MPKKIPFASQDLAISNVMIRCGDHGSGRLSLLQIFDDGFRAGPGAELLVNLLQVGVDRPGADAQCASDLLVRAARAEATENVLLAPGKGGGFQCAVAFCGKKEE